MLVASLHNKLRPDEERMEDLLTAQVLGAARYLPADACWGPLVGAARTRSGERLALAELPDDVETRFWPRWRHDDGRTTEPDLVLRWPGALLVVEVKYRSGKSSVADPETDAVTDQLGRQLVLARERATAEGRGTWGVLYLTTDPTQPGRSLQASLDEVQAKAGWDATPFLAWASWPDVHDGLLAWTPIARGHRQMRADLLAYLDRLGFSRFAGVHVVPPIPALWRFARATPWATPTPPPTWTFGANS
jgi:hypothetical protein